MSTARLKTGYFTLEGLNSFATTYYLYYLYFFMQSQFGFGNEANLALAAFNGFIYMLASFWGGKFAQCFGYFTALKLGFTVMTASLAVGGQVNTATGQVVIMSVFLVGTCLTWPTLEALVSEGEPRAGLQHMVGIYNVVWAGTGALAYFTGGAMLEKLGLRSLFYVPAAVLFGQLLLTLWLEFQSRRAGLSFNVQRSMLNVGCSPEAHSSNPERVRAKAFLRMAWLANPFAYIAINTLIAVVPGVAQRLGLTPMLAGFFCSVWCFARLAAFFGLWLWPGWHYRFRWLVASYLALIGAFALILTVPSLAVLVLVQVVFGGAIGLIYYSSLFYSMDVGETKGEHGGIHEAAIGLGNLTGPAAGAAALHFAPQYLHSGTAAVTVLLLGGLGGLLAIWRTTKS